MPSGSVENWKFAGTLVGFSKVNVRTLVVPTELSPKLITFEENCKFGPMPFPEHLILTVFPDIVVMLK